MSHQHSHPCSTSPAAAWHELSLLHEAEDSRAKQHIPGMLYKSSPPNLTSVFFLESGEKREANTCSGGALGRQRA